MERTWMNSQPGPSVRYQHQPRFDSRSHRQPRKQNSLPSLPKMQMDTPKHTSEASQIKLTRRLRGRSETAVTLWLRTRRSTTFESRSRPTPASIPSSRLTACLPAQSCDHWSAFEQPTAAFHIITWR